MRYAFIGPENEVRQVIAGALYPEQLAQFERDYAVIFGATSVVEIGDDAISVWIGGTYTPEAGFTPPPSPEPEPIVADAPIEEIVEETTNDAA
jgi:hypothetical protein